MRAIRDNWAFILLLLIALLLVFLLIGLQSAILTSQQDPTLSQERSFFYILRQQIALMIAPATDTPTPAPPTATLEPPTATPLPPPPTATPLPPPPTVTPLPLLATAASVALPVVPATALPTQIVLPTHTLAPPPTATVAAPPPQAVAITSTQLVTQNLTVSADFRIGYFDRQDGCPFVTEVVRYVLERDLNFSVELVPFSSIDQLYLALAATDDAQQIDLTVCFTDPDDRVYFEKHFGFVLLIGSAYRQFDNKSFLILSNAAAKKVIQRDLPCLYNFLTKLKIDTTDFPNQNALNWYETHRDLIRSWTVCQ